LLHTYRTSYAISLYIIACAVLTIIATLMLPDRSRTDISTLEIEPVPRGTRAA
jgi:hypothetical protein